MGCATSSPTVKTRYVPLDNPSPICWAVGVDDSFKQSPDLESAKLDDVKTDDDVEILAKTALDDVAVLDKAFKDLVGEVDKIEIRCEGEKEEVLILRRQTQESIDELNQS